MKLIGMTSIAVLFGLTQPFPGCDPTLGYPNSSEESVIAGGQTVQGEPGETGPQGSQGEQGEPGAPGAQGTTGTQGQMGTQGAGGAQGQMGSMGLAGASPFELIGSNAVFMTGNVGIGTETPASLLTVAGQVELIGSDSRIRFADGTTLSSAGSSAIGDITSVVAGSGLAGGGTAGDVTLNLAFGGSGGSGAPAHSDHFHSSLAGSDGNPLTALAMDAAGNAAFSQNALIAGTLGVTGATALSSLTTSGAATLNSAAITNAVTVGGTLGVTGATTLSSLTTSGAATLNSAAVTNAATIGGTLATSGNATFGGTVGTIGNTTLTLQANGVTGLRVVPTATTPNVLGGAATNVYTVGVAGATIAGGADNNVTDSFGVVGGGSFNRAGDNFGSASDQLGATVAGGLTNVASADRSSIGGGGQNTASGIVSTIAGGISNYVSVYGGTIGGGDTNNVSGFVGTVAGGLQNSATGSYATCGGGNDNLASNSYSTVAGGTGNDATGAVAFIGGGGGNVVSGGYAAILGGAGNVVNQSYSVCGGGTANTVSGAYSTLSGGADNIASGLWSTVPGGTTNTASGFRTFAAGGAATASHHNSFVWSGGNGEATSSFAVDSATFRCHGGMRIYTATGTATGVELAAGGGSWGMLSDRNVKENLKQVDPLAVLDRLCALDISTWNYTTQSDTIRHIGPMAQDFHAAFGVGEDERRITTIDSDGVALASIQGLKRLVDEKDVQIDKLTRNLQALEDRLAALECTSNAAQR